MKRKLLSLLVQYALLLAIVVTINFFIVYLVPGDAVEMMSRGLTEAGAENFPEETRAMLRQYFGLDQPVLTQFVNYLRGLAVGDLGVSYFYQRPVAQIIFDYASRTLILISAGIGLALLIGVPSGAFSAARRGQKADTFLLFSQMTLHSIPPFLISTFLLIIFAVVLKWLPFSGSAQIGQTSAPGAFEMLARDFKHFILPVAALALWESTAVYYFTRNALIDILGEDYILVARAKGLSGKAVLFRHALRVALPTLIARFALVFGTAIGGAFFVEDVFNFPGIATLALAAFRNYDYTLLRGIFLLLTVSILVVNFIADAFLYKLDPRTSNAS